LPTAKTWRSKEPQQPMGALPAWWSLRGMGTEIGKIAAMLGRSKPPDTPLQRRLAVLGRWLAAAALVVCAVVFVAGVATGQPAEEMFLTAVSLAVAAIPEGLPAVVTVALALGARRMATRRAVIRRLPAVETLGSVSVICTDKTGTLTENQMTVERVWTPAGTTPSTAAGTPLRARCTVRMATTPGCSGKPTLGRIPHASNVEPVAAPIGVQLTAVEGPMARRVADLRAAFGVLAGPSWRDPWSVPAPLRGPTLAEPVRVALVVDPAGQGTADQVQDGVRKAASALDDAGYAVEEVEPPSIVAAAKALLDMLNTPETRAGWQYVSPSMPADTQRFMSAFYEVAGDPDPVAIMQSFAVRQSLLRAWGEFQEQHPLIVAPIFTDLPFEVGTDLEDGRVAQTIRGMRMTLAVNALGLPAVALPVGIGAGLPQSVQVIGPRYREDLCLDAAAALEERFGIITPIDPR
jgi:hypothetical protein